MSLFIKVYTMFDHRECSVTNGKRLMAYIIDWFLGSLCTLLPMCMLWMMWTQDIDNMNKANVLLIAGQVGDTQAYLAGTLSIVFALLYYVVIPWKLHPGQTPGKRAMGFKIVQTDGSDVTLKSLVMREIIGIIIIEGAMYNVSGIWHSMLSLATNINFINILMYVGLAISCISGFMILKIQSRRMIHDYIANTMVVESEEDKKANQSI